MSDARMVPSEAGKGPQPGHHRRLAVPRQARPGRGAPAGWRPRPRNLYCLVARARGPVCRRV